MNLSPELDYLLSPLAIRERSQKIYDLALDGKTHFNLNLDRFESVAEFVLAVIKKNYPDLKVPFHSRWRHFNVGNIDRMSWLDQALLQKSNLEKAMAKLDLAFISVLLDAGAGMKWRYTEKKTGKIFSKSEGLALASLEMFMNGHFSDFSHQDALRVDSKCLTTLSHKQLALGFSVTESNPLEGIEGRLHLVKSLGIALQKNTQIFADARPGGILKTILDLGHGAIEAPELLKLVLIGLSKIWPGRIEMQGISLGDCWSYSPLGTKGSFESLVPFHKLSQWLTYSLIEPIEEFGIKVTNINQLTGLSEYRNGGLMIDTHLVVPKDPESLKIAHLPSSEFIVEWRAITLVLLDLLGEKVRSNLNKTVEEFPLACLLEGGTWAAGREVAQSLRPESGGSPIILKSDGTVF